MEQHHKRVILASGSPRRKELMGGLDVDFTIDTENSFVEEYDSSIPHEKIPVLMSQGKSHGFHRGLEDDEILVTADTMVLLDNYALGKPHSREDAADMLHKMSGKTHKVITAVTIRDNSREETFTDETLVTFKELSDEEINFYIDRYKPFDKAGAYGVQEWIGYVAISKLEGSFYNVMGFPTHKVYEALKRFF